MTPPTTTTSPNYIIYEGNHPELLQKKDEEKEKAIKRYIKGETIHHIGITSKYLSTKEVRTIIQESGYKRNKGTQKRRTKRILKEAILKDFSKGMLKTKIIKEYHICPKTVNYIIKDYPYKYQVTKEGNFKTVGEHRGNRKYSKLTLFDLNLAHELYSKGKSVSTKEVCEKLNTYYNTLQPAYKKLKRGDLKDAYRAYNDYHGSIEYPLTKLDGGESI